MEDKLTIEKLKELEEKRTQGEWVLQKTENQNIFEVSIIRNRTESPICYSEAYIPHKVKLQDMEVVAITPQLIKEHIALLEKIEKYKLQLLDELDIFTSDTFNKFREIFEV